MATEAAFETAIPLDFSKLHGLVPVVLQHARTREVLMVGFVDQAAWQKTLATGRVWLFRRTLGRVQQKGEEDGRYVVIRRLTIDCDRDTVLLEVLPEGPVCHYGGPSCFIHAVPARHGE